MTIHFWCRYRSALIWEDKTVDYFTTVTSLKEKIRRPVCGLLDNAPGTAVIYSCDDQSEFGRMSLCQIPRDGQQQYIHMGDGSSNTVSGQRSRSEFKSSSWQTLPDLTQVNVSGLGQHRRLWEMMTCPSGHVTHVLLACDVSASCWAESDVTFSLHPETWALPMPRSCPVPQRMISLAPSFPCDSDKWRVPYSLVCNHRRDCLDGSDETFCKFTPCSWQSETQCYNEQVGLDDCIHH